MLSKVSTVNGNITSGLYANVRGIGLQRLWKNEICEILESGEFRMDLLYMQQCPGMKTWGVVEMSLSDTKQHNS